jgi:recombination protein RecA
MAPPFKEVEFDIMYGEGISKTGEILDIGVESTVVEKSGSWYSYNGERIGQGRENVKKFLLDNQDIFDSIYRKIRQQLGLEKPDEQVDTKAAKNAPKKSD